MKKLLLFTLALGLGTMTYAQSITKQAYKQDTKAPDALTRIDYASMDQAGPVNHHKSTKGAISFITLGYSNNVYTMLVEQQSCLTTNEAVGVLSFTHRGKVGDNGATASGDIMNSYSTDGGNTWTTHLMLQNSATYANRYPSGVIYNPSGNTTAANASIVYCGPSHNSGNWDHNYFGSGQFDSSNIVNQYIPSYGALIRMGMTATSDGKIHVVGPAYTSTPQTLDTLYIMTGTFNSTTNGFDWTTTKFDSLGFVVRTDGSEAAYAWHFNTAWSDDGTIGYFWTLGRNAANDYRSYQPLVWKTTDSGANWAQMPVFDFSTITELTSRLQPMRGTTTSRPQFSSAVDGVVDANGDLHLIAEVKAAFSNNDDSLGYSYLVAGVAPYPMTNPIFDVYTTTTGWAARFLGRTFTIDVDPAESGYGSGTDAIGWDHRIQAGRTKNGTKIFAGWSDSDTASAPDASNGFKMNAFPNLIVAAWDITSGKQTNPTNFTMGSAQDGDCFFHYLSDIIIENNGTYTIPMTEIDKGNGPIDPVTHNFVKGIEFTDADFVTNPGFATQVNNIATVSQNRPNPFNGYTTIDVTLTESSNVVIEVLNITGQKVMELNNGTLNAGSHTFRIDGSQLSSGVYFYTVHAGNSSLTKKMIVQ
jgi:hypothetical protein